MFSGRSLIHANSSLITDLLVHGPWSIVHSSWPLVKSTEAIAFCLPKERMINDQ